MNPSNEDTEAEFNKFLGSQADLDMITYLSKAHRIGKEYLLEKARNDFIDKYSITKFGRWNIDVNALGMTKTIGFYGYSENSWKKIFSRNLFLSHLSQIEIGIAKYLAMYTFPDEEEKVGSEISSWYYMFPYFTHPFFENGEFEKKFERIFEEENNRNPLPPRGGKIKKPDLIDMYICRYVQRELGDINLGEYTRRMREEISDLVKVHERAVETRFRRLEEKKIIYPVNPLNFTELSYVDVFFITAYEEVFRFMKTLNKLNIITAISFMENNSKNILYIQCPYDKKNTIANILNELDRKSQIFSIVNTYVNRGLPYRYYLRKYKKQKYNHTKT